jgi:hypothetical protein
MERMIRKTARTLSALALAALLTASLTSCASPFSEHGEDVRGKIMNRDWREMHRKYDRYFLGVDWDDPYMDWKDESYATGPMHQH